MAKNFVLQVASLVTLFVSIPAFIALLFGIINLQFPDAADQYWQIDSAQNSIRYSIAVLVIFFPAYLALTRMVNKARRTEGALYHTLTKWLIYIALLIAGVVMLTDLAVVVYTFLGGEITTRFILKALALLAVIAAAFYYYAQDAKDHWQDHEKESIRIGIGALAVVAIAAIYGITLIDTPGVAREIRLDQEQISDLMDMQWRIEAYYQETNSFPANLDQVYQDFEAPQAPEGREAYSYSPTGPDTYELCATFAHPTPEGERQAHRPSFAGDAVYLQNQNWEHPAGIKCFERRIIPLERQ